MSKKQHIEPINDKGQLHGLCIGYWVNGNIMYKERVVNGIPHGLWIRYRQDGKLHYKDYRIKGKFLYSEWYNNANKITFDI